MGTYWSSCTLLCGGGVHLSSLQQLGAGVQTPQLAAATAGGGSGPPPRESENSGGVRAKKARCFLALESTKKLTKIFFWSFFKQNVQILN